MFLEAFLVFEDKQCKKSSPRAGIFFGRSLGR